VDPSPVEPPELSFTQQQLLDQLRARAETTAAGLHSRTARRGPVRRVGRALTVAAAFLALLTVMTVGLAAYEYKHLDANITRVAVLQTSDANITYADVQLHAQNYLMIGSDDPSGTATQKGGGSQAETSILIHLSPDRKQAVGISVPRQA
jgi:anionic cell wall polymer biosynthesis LytR-Cps2A-Psr (LCP) family protein